MAVSTTIELVSSDITIDDLKTLEASEPQNTSKPKTLALKDIHVADKAFQYRLKDYDRAASLDHVKSLASDLRSQQKPFDALVVVPIGAKFFVIDGHHRLSAYKAVQWAKTVPVVVRKITLQEARDAALGYNIKGKLSLTTTAKQEAAWGFVKEGRSKNKVHELTLVSKGNIGNMKRVRLELLDKGIDLDGMTWRRALRHGKDTGEDFDRGAYVNEKAIALKGKLLEAAGGVNLLSDPEILAEALVMISERLPTALIEQWHEEAYDYVEWHREAIEEERRATEALDI